MHARDVPGLSPSVGSSSVLPCRPIRSTAEEPGIVGVGQGRTSFHDLYRRQCPRGWKPADAEEYNSVCMALGPSSRRWRFPRLVAWILKRSQAGRGGAAKKEYLDLFPWLRSLHRGSPPEGTL